MLMPHPATLRGLLTEYETLLAVDALVDDSVPGRRLEDLAYTLCVSTGTREIAQALQVARDYLDQTIDATTGIGKTTGPGPARTVIATGRRSRPASSAPALHS
ncbi:DUF5133 domain-containing protein [Streptomyces sp. NPDC001068]|uniref:DUF5133 domain-containing protein n=1 Tax=Streptomyces sp. NPDC001068 TaxID=3364544 RepID=UPI0036C63EEA